MKNLNTSSTLAELLDSKDKTIYRSALGILKRIKEIKKNLYLNTGICPDCGGKTTLLIERKNSCTIIQEEKCKKCDYHWIRQN